MENPTMHIWTESWRNSNPEKFKNIYADDALIFPPDKSVVRGNQNILNFMKGGLGKVDVFFETEELMISETLAFEYGTFKDAELSDGKVLGEGQYSITWVWDNSIWKIMCHTWSMPVKYE